MPDGLPGLDEREHGLLMRRLAAGSPGDAPAPLTAGVAQPVHAWERCPNGSSLEEWPMSRYLSEHLLLGHRVFADEAQRQAFRKVRSAQPPGTPAQALPTRHPTDDPGAERFCYRLVPERENRLAKTHLPNLLSPARMERLRGWFVDADNRVDALPS